MTIFDKVTITYRKLSGVSVDKFVLFYSTKIFYYKRLKKVRRSLEIFKNENIHKSRPREHKLS